MYTPGQVLLLAFSQRSNDLNERQFAQGLISQLTGGKQTLKDVIPHLCQSSLTDLAEIKI